MRGYGASDKPEGIAKYHLFDCLAQDVRAAVNHMRALGKPLLVAHDWGAATSWAYVGQGVGAGEWDVAGYVSLSNPPSELFRKNLTRRQMWASLYMVFFNMPALPEWLLGLGNAWLVGLILNDTRSKRREKRWLDLYRTDKLQPAALRAQTNYCTPLPAPDAFAPATADGSAACGRASTIPSATSSRSSRLQGRQCGSIRLRGISRSSSLRLIE